MFSIDVEIEHSIFEFTSGHISDLIDSLSSVGFTEMEVPGNYTIKDFVFSNRYPDLIFSKEEIDYLDSLSFIQFRILDSENLTLGLFTCKEGVIHENVTIILQLIIEKCMRKSVMCFFVTPNWSRLVLGIYAGKLSRQLVFASKPMNNSSYRQYLEEIFTVISMQETDFLEQIMDYIHQSYFTYEENRDAAKYNMVDALRMDNTFLKSDFRMSKEEILIPNPTELDELNKVINQTNFIKENEYLDDYLIEIFKTTHVDDSVIDNLDYGEDLNLDEDPISELQDMDDLDKLIDWDKLDFDDPTKLIESI